MLNYFFGYLYIPLSHPYLYFIFSVQPYSYGGNYAESDEYLDDEDSNDENHYRNDYPDSDDEDRLR